MSARDQFLFWLGEQLRVHILPWNVADAGKRLLAAARAEAESRAPEDTVCMPSPAPKRRQGGLL
jgi:hypothetical protein